MAWTTPKTDWATGELVTAEDMNAVGENLAVLGNLAKASYLTTARYERYTNDYVDIDSDNLNLTITTTGRDVLVHFHGYAHAAGGNTLTTILAVDVDGTRYTGMSVALEGYYFTPIVFTRLFEGLSAGSHTFKMLWTGQNNKGMLLAENAQFWVREI